MADTSVEFQELRFVLEPKETHVYVFIQVTSAFADAPHTVQGWHYKAFPLGMPAGKILAEMFSTDDPMLWPQQVPPEKPAHERFTPDPDAPIKMLNRILSGEDPKEIMKEIIAGIKVADPAPGDAKE